MRTTICFNLLHHNVSILQNQVNVSDIVNKFFLLHTKAPSKEGFRISSCSKQEPLFDMQKKDKSTKKYLKKFYLSLITI